MINKGILGGECNRTVCHDKAQHYNLGTYAYYCTRCAREIQEHAPAQMVLFIHFAKEGFVRFQPAAEFLGVPELAIGQLMMDGVIHPEGFNISVKELQAVKKDERYLESLK